MFCVDKTPIKKIDHALQLGFWSSEFAFLRWTRVPDRKNTHILIGYLLQIVLSSSWFCIAEVDLTHLCRGYSKYGLDLIPWILLFNPCKFQHSFRVGLNLTLSILLVYTNDIILWYLCYNVEHEFSRIISSSVSLEI